MSIIKRSLLAIVTVFILAQCQVDFYCPQLTCGEYIGTDVCYLHDVEQPTQFIQGDGRQNISTKSFEGIAVCPFSRLNGKYAWLDETVQQIDLSFDPSQSLYYQKRVKGFCEDVKAFSQDLLPGRDCKESYNCRKQLCSDNLCVGSSVHTYCHSHEDCDPGLYCRQARNWPFQSTCSTLRSSYEACESDYQCEINHYCWYASADDRFYNQMKCLPLYSQDVYQSFGWYSVDENVPTYEEFQQNGKYCKSGVAYPASKWEARCSNVTMVSFNSQPLDDPYPCDPSLITQKCHLHMSIHSDNVGYSIGTRSFVQTPCKCSMDGTISGYCDSVIGTHYYEKAMGALKNVYDKSNCHTLDRFDFRAQKDTCGIGTSNEEWRFAVDKYFNVTHWPYIQTEEMFTCISSFSADSYDNLSLDNGRMLVIGVSLAIVMSLIS